MTITTRFMTAEELERSPNRDGLWEVIDGELVEVTGTGGEHAVVTLKVIVRLDNFVASRRLGTVLLPDSGLVLAEGPLVMRLPDTGFISAERLPLDQIPRGYIRTVPDLVVEVRSPGDSRREFGVRGMMWREAGATLVWLIDPITQTVTEIDRLGEPRELTLEESLDGADVLPGFQLPVQEIFTI